MNYRFHACAPPRALLALAAFLALGGCFSPPSHQTQRTQADGARPVSLVPLAPKGLVRWPFEFSWSASAAPGSIYRVTVVDAADRHLIDLETRDTHVAAPSELRPMLGGSQPFYWRVRVEGTAAGLSTPPTEFRLQ